jgi:hypothetical protein
MGYMILEAASRDRHICTPDEWNKTYRPMILSQVNAVLQFVNKFTNRSAAQVQIPQPAPIAAQISSTAPPPLVNNPAGIPIIAPGKHGFNKDELHIPESKRRRSTAPGASSSPSSNVDPGTVPPTTQTPITMGTPSSYPVATPAKRPSTDSPAPPPAKMQVGLGPSGPVPQRDRAQEEAIARRQAKEKSEELEREEARKNPLEYAKNQMYKAMGVKEPGKRTEAPAPKLLGLADQIKQKGEAAKETKSTTNGTAKDTEKTPTGQKVQLPSPPWSGTITPRQLAETFSQVTDFEFGLTMTPLQHDPFSTEDSMEDLFADSEVQESADKPEQTERSTEEQNDWGGLSPLGGDFGSDEVYSWTRGFTIPWNGDMNTIFEQTNTLGVVA